MKVLRNGSLRPFDRLSFCTKLIRDLARWLPASERDAFASYRFEPGRYIREKLGWTPWSGTDEAPGQQQILDAYVLALRQQHAQRRFEAGETDEAALTLERDGSDRPPIWRPGQVIQNCIRVEAGHSVGKCTAISELITLSDGTRRTAGELIGKRFKLLTLVNGKPAEVDARAEFNAVETVYELVTETGKRVTRNAQHPFFVAAGTFRLGDRPEICVRGFTPLSQIQTGDLVAVAEELPAFGNSRLPDHKIKILAYLLGEGGYTRDRVRFSQQGGRVLDEFEECAQDLGCSVVSISQYDYHVYREPQRKKRGFSPAINFLMECGLFGIHSREKRVPEGVFSFSRRQLCLFLNRLFATGGRASVDKNAVREIGFCSASRGLVEDIAYLLQKLGVHARIAKKTKVHAWTLNIKDASDQMAFIETVGIFGKEAAVDAVAQEARRIRDRTPGGIAGREDRLRWCHKNAPEGTRWERVVSVTALAEQQPTVAIEVSGHHTFLTEFWEHNTMLASGLVNHFFDCFAPSIVYTFAPTWKQIHDLLWKEIKASRRGKGLPGRVLDLALVVSDEHFANGVAASNAGGRGTERVQGQHSPYLMFVCDEAEGIAEYVPEAINSMASGGISVVLLLANPRTRQSWFYRWRELSRVRNFRMSCLGHPNVTQGRDCIPGAVRRDYVESMVEAHCEVVEEASEDDHTFALPWRPEVIYRPDAEFLFRVLGVAPANVAEDTFVPVGRFEAACRREPVSDRPACGWIGVDAAGYGNDLGTIYVRHDGAIWRAATCSKPAGDQDSTDYWQKTRRAALALAERGVRRLQVRIDAGGGFGNGVYDRLKRDDTLIRSFAEFKLFMIHFGGGPRDAAAYRDLGTQMYAEAAESIKGLALLKPPPTLEGDLCARRYQWVNWQGIEVKKLVEKAVFRKEQGRSPDDGDGFVLCVAPDLLFQSPGSYVAGGSPHGPHPPAPSPTLWEKGRR